MLAAMTRVKNRVCVSAIAYKFEVDGADATTAAAIDAIAESAKEMLEMCR